MYKYCYSNEGAIYAKGLLQRVNNITKLPRVLRSILPNATFNLYKPILGKYESSNEEQESKNED